MDELAASGELKDYRRETLVGQLYGFLTQAAMSLRDARNKRQAANEVKAIIRDFLYSSAQGLRMPPSTSEARTRRFNFQRAYQLFSKAGNNLKTVLYS